MVRYPLSYSHPIWKWDFQYLKVSERLSKESYFWLVFNAPGYWIKKRNKILVLKVYIHTYEIKNTEKNEEKTHKKM